MTLNRSATLAMRRLLEALRPAAISMLCASVWALGALSSRSAESPASAATQSVPSEAGAYAPKRFTAQHVGIFNGRSVRYRVQSGDTNLVDEHGLIGSIFSFSYLKEGVTDPSSRPVTFIYNGGPGSSSVWLHLGVLGPKRVKLDRDVNPSTLPPYVLEANPDCLLDITDLVFIDPIGTGFSRIRGHGKPEDFYGVDRDAASIAQFISAWMTGNGRWNSPKYLVGESYGTIRSAVIMRMLMGGPAYGGVLNAISINGITLLGSVLEAGATEGGDQDYVYRLPNFAATAWYHGKIDKAGRTLETFVNEAEQFAETDYSHALFSGSRLSQDKRQSIAATLSSFTGISAEDILAANLRISNRIFAHNLLASANQDVGLYDSRYTLTRGTELAADEVGDDPAMARYTPAFNAAWHDYLLQDLGVRLNEPYETIVWKGVNAVWDYDRAGVPKSQSYAAEFAAAMRRNPELKILVASGYFDLVTPFMSAEYTLAQAGVPLDRVRFTRYASGHMVYVGGTASEFAADMRRLYVR
jgi:carboxypeptidase C (cathepsin A)